jgi:hypothetical protein
MKNSGKKSLIVLASLSLIFVVLPSVSVAKSSDTNTRKFTRWDYYSYKYVGAKLQRQILPSENNAGCSPCTWTTKDSRGAKSFDPIRAQAFNAIKAFGKKQKLTPTDIEWRFTKNVQPSLVKMYKKLNTDALTYWQSQLVKPLPYRIVVGTEKDRAEFKTIVSESQNGPNSLTMINGFFDRYANLQDYEKARPVGGGTPIKDVLISGKKDVYQVLYHVGSFTTDQKVFATTSAHEITHVLQIHRSNNIGYNNSMPPTLWEGSANLFGAGIPMPNVAWFSDELDHQLMRFLSNFAKITPMKTEADVVNLLIKAERTDAEISIEAGYYIGAVLFEWIVAKHGVEKYLELLDATATAPSFNGAMKKTYGVGKDEIYKQAAPYVLKNYQRVLNVFNG